MGIPDLNPGRVDTTVEATEPELLLYQPDERGRLTLLGVEYFVPVVIVDGKPYFGTTPPRVTAPAPTLLGVALEGPMPGHNPQMPWHYDRHVWIWRHNPAGMFATWNHAVSCPSE